MIATTALAALEKGNITTAPLLDALHVPFPDWVFHRLSLIQAAWLPAPLVDVILRIWRQYHFDVDSYRTLYSAGIFRPVAPPIGALASQRVLS